MKEPPKEREIIKKTVFTAEFDFENSVLEQSLELNNNGSKGTE